MLQNLNKFNCKQKPFCFVLTVLKLACQPSFTVAMTVIIIVYRYIAISYCSTSLALQNEPGFLLVSLMCDGHIFKFEVLHVNRLIRPMLVSLLDRMIYCWKTNFHLFLHFKSHLLTPYTPPSPQFST